MHVAQPNLFTREDTLFGVCQGLGEDFGFNPFIPRLGLTVLLYLNPVAALGLYAAGAVVVLASRLLVPNPRRPATPIAATPARPEADAAPGMEPAALAA
jgi:phage shock protein C